MKQRSVSMKQMSVSMKQRSVSMKQRNVSMKQRSVSKFACLAQVERVRKAQEDSIRRLQEEEDTNFAKARFHPPSLCHTFDFADFDLRDKIVGGSPCHPRTPAFEPCPCLIWWPCLLHLSQSEYLCPSLNFISENEF